MADEDGPELRPASPRGEQIDVGTMIEIARHYYLEDWSKVALADKYDLSRFQIARALRDARQRGMVRIEISGDGIIDPRLGELVARKLHLQTAVVTKPSALATSIVVRQLGKALADFLSATVAEGQVLGLTWSRVADSAAEQLAHLERATIVELVGPLQVDGDIGGAGEAVRRFADVGGGEAVPMYAPMIVDSARTAEALRQSPEVRETLAWHDRLDVAVLSISAWGSAQSRLYRWLTPDLRRLGQSLGACGEISGRIFTGTGDPVVEVVDARLIGVTIEQMRSARLSIGTSWGHGNAGAIRAAAAAGFVSGVVIDSDAAAALLAT